jgi:hypothetical protein
LTLINRLVTIKETGAENLEAVRLAAFVATFQGFATPKLTRKQKTLKDGLQK